MASHTRIPDGPLHGAPIEKAVALIKQDRVHLLQGARVYRVQGEHAAYDVIVSTDGIHCPCPARIALCSHALAVAAASVSWPWNEPVPERLIRDLGLQS